MIQSIYDGMWERFKVASEKNEHELDLNLLDQMNDTRRGVTALAYLNQGSQAVLDEILSFQRTVQQIEPDQYYHPLDELHLTVLSVISCVPEFELNQINVKAYVEIFSKVLRDADPVEINYRGITASPNCIVIQGFPVADTLEKIRDDLREQLSRAGLRVSFDSRYKQVTAHSSLIRFRVPISDGPQLLALCQPYRDHEFGSIVLTDFELVFNNWYQNLAVTTLLARCSLESEVQIQSMSYF
ncbi:hypothetical protein [Vibrio sp. L3-7]|uniref:2'-5' RNA ligase family protein n=1 Tax=Vibrio sp. L3-7 TaxID=2912253 RepID=UPI001191BE49|nr:hypothetical protein [Vibrio sp. L3-7]MCF7505079.1 hypothetical protein [Vibrio sp. L3-7]TVU79327.1 hypothetical protein FQP87_02650 [Vibrio tasmaniensis]